MEIRDYLIDCSQFDWQKLLAPWHWLLPHTPTPWMMNRFGDLFFTTDDGQVWCLGLDVGSLKCLAQTKDEFCDKLDQGDNANDWLMIPLVDRLVELGVTLGKGQCYAFIKSPVLGGDYTVENVMVRDVEIIYVALGPVFEKIKDLPDGTEVVIRVER